MKCIFITPDQAQAEYFQPTSAGRLLPKNEKASESPSNIKQTYEVYDNAIFVNGVSSQLKGMIALFGIAFLVTIPLVWWMLLSGTIGSLIGAVERDDSFSIIFSIVSALVILIACVFALVNGVKALRFDLLSPTRIPIIFNKRTKKVYVFSVEIPDTYNFRPSEMLKAFMPWYALVIEYDWACLEAIFSEKMIATSDTSARKRYFVEIYAKEKPDSNKVIGSFLLAPPFVGKETCLNYWEYIRRYMEEDGLAMIPNDKIAPPIPKNIFQAAQLAMPYFWPFILAGAAYSIYFFWGKGNPLFYTGPNGLIMQFVAFVSSLSVGVIFFNWVGHRLGSKFEIPKNILDDVGNKIKIVDEVSSPV